VPRMIRPRFGQGPFRAAVMGGFGRRCAVTGEKTLPILDAAHIRSWAEGGENRPGNGLPLRTDVHRLFDLGYVTVNHEFLPSADGLDWHHADRRARPGEHVPL
jgi:putative restriction endonuclease